MPAFKIVRRLLLVGVLLLVAAALTLPLLFDPNAFKGELTKLVREKTGRELTITGPIDLSVFPWLAVEVQGVRLGNAPGFGIQPFAEAKEVKVGVRLLPLLRREVEVSSVTLEGLSLHLARNRAGVANWEDLNGGGGPPEKSATKPAAPPAAAPLAALRLGGVQVEDASIEWRDALRGVRYAVQDLDLEVGRVEPGEPFDLRLQGKVTASRPTLQGRFSLTGRMRIDATLARIEVASLALETDLSGKGLPGGKLDAELGLEATVDRAAGTLTMPRFSLAALDLRVAGNLEGKGLNANRPEFSGHLKADEFVPREVLAKLGVTLPPLRDPAVLSKADLEAGFTATPASLALDPLRLRFDDTTLEGNLRLPSFEGPKVRYRLSLDTIDLDRYLPPKEKSVEGKQAPAPQAATPGQAAAGAAAELPLESLRRLDLDGTLTIGELKAFQLRSRNITLTTRASGGKIRLHPASAELYEGKYEGDFRLDVRGRQPAFSMNEKVIAIQAGPLLRDLTGKAAMTGRGEVQVKLTGKGLDPEQIKPTLNGHLSLSFRDGAIAGIDIPRMIREAQARLKGQTLPAANGPGQTDFTSLTATAAVKEGVLLNDDLRLQSPLLRAAGRGKVDLPRNRIDYLLTVKLVGTLEGEGGKPMESLRGLAIPLRIQGPLPSPRYRVELDRVLKKTVERKVRKRLEKHLLPQLQKRFGDRLEGLFGR